jgi:hypothetical protein
MIGLGFLKSGKGIVKTLAVLAVVGGLAYMAWDYRSLASENATLEQRVEQWRGNAEAWEKATKVQLAKVRQAREAARSHRARLERLEKRRAARERDYREEIKDDPKARKWERVALPNPVAGWVRELAGTTPDGRAQESRRADRDGGAEGGADAGERAGGAGDD